MLQKKFIFKLRMKCDAYYNTHQLSEVELEYASPVTAPLINDVVAKDLPPDRTPEGGRSYFCFSVVRNIWSIYHPAA